MGGIVELNYATLMARYKKEFTPHPDNGIGTRIYRALSWLCRTEQCEDDDARFIFLWISFNAVYAQKFSDKQISRESNIFGVFMDLLVNMDREQLLFSVVWSEFSGSIRGLLENPYIFAPFWRFQSGEIREGDWKKRFDEEQSVIKRALSNKHTEFILYRVFNRLYVLRNQMIHGGATWGGSTNRDQVRDGSAILGKIVPLVIQILMNYPDAFDDKPPEYSVLGENKEMP